MQKQKPVVDGNELIRSLRAWKKFHREEREAVLAGPYGTVLGELFRMFENLKHCQPAQLIGIARSIDWESIDYDTKLVVIHELNTAITAFRVKHGLPEIDDGLPNEPDTPFRTIRTIVLSPSPHTRAPTEAQLGLSNRNCNIRGQT
jgi:hypothetical protein